MESEEEVSDEDEDDNNIKTNYILIQSICFSTVDDFLNCASLSFEAGWDPKYNVKPPKTIYSKIKSQETHMMYPCMVSNIGTR